MGKTEVVMDTNVAVVANGKTEQAGRRCVRECIAKLRHIRNECCLLLDNGNLILEEYRKNLSLSGQPGPGDGFYKWLFDNQANPEHCQKVPLKPHIDREFEKFPDDPNLESFDRDDRKFVAVALASGTAPKVLNASDPDWWFHCQALRQHGVEVVFLCPDLMRARS